MPDNYLTTVATFTYVHEAHIAKAALEANGIPSLIPDEHTISAQWLYSNALGGVRLQVPTEQLAKARDILAQDHSHDVEEEFEINQPRCRSCGSTKLVPHTAGKKPAFIVFLLMGFPLFFYKHGTKCESCGAFNSPD